MLQVRGYEGKLPNDLVLVHFIFHGSRIVFLFHLIDLCLIIYFRQCQMCEKRVVKTRQVKKNVRSHLILLVRNDEMGAYMPLLRVHVLTTRGQHSSKSDCYRFWNCLMTELIFYYFSVPQEFQQRSLLTINQSSQIVFCYMLNVLRHEMSKWRLFPHSIIKIKRNLLPKHDLFWVYTPVGPEKWKRKTNNIHFCQKQKLTHAHLRGWGASNGPA